VIGGLCRRWLAGFLSALCLFLGSLVAEDRWTAGPAMVQVRIQVTMADERQLGAYPRRWVPAFVFVDDRNENPIRVRVRVKGRSGSLRPVQENPSLTLDVVGEGNLVGGVRRVHLDNAVEDPGRLHAAFGAEVFRRIGIPSPRVMWARVEFNGRSLGWYVLKEGFTQGFAERSGLGSGTALAEPRSGADVGGELDIKEDGAAALPALAVWRDLGAWMARTPPPQDRETLGKWVDLHWFEGFAAGEVILAHRDGYSLARNNFRLAFSTAGIRWIPWGMDQLLVSRTFPVHPVFSGSLAKACFEGESGHVRWQAALERGLRSVEDMAAWEVWFAAVDERLRPHLQGHERKELDAAVADLRMRWVERLEWVRSQLTAAASSPAWVDGQMKLDGWRVQGLPQGAGGGIVEGPAGVRSLWLRAEGVTSAAWTTTVRLNPGNYRFQGRICVSGVVPLDFGVHHGAALRVLGKAERSPVIVGDGKWREVFVDFRVADASADLSLLCELRGRAGQAWFDVGSLQLLRIE
jgi:CotH kinase protein